MRTVALAMSHQDLDHAPSQHFGKAKWVLLVREGAEPRFLRNEGLNGRYVAELLAREGCTDVILLHAGEGALHHLKAANLRLWQALPELPARAQLERLSTNLLAPYQPPLQQLPRGTLPN